MEPVQGELCPVERTDHAACCLNYGEDHPQLLVYGGMRKEGMSNDPKILGDMWILDVNTGKWTEVSLSMWHKCKNSQFAIGRTSHAHAHSLCFYRLQIPYSAKFSRGLSTKIVL